MYPLDQFVTVITEKLICFNQKYVQDMMKEEAFDICEKLLSHQAHLYVCGDVKMADDVCKTLQVRLSGVLVSCC